MRKKNKFLIIIIIILTPIIVHILNILLPCRYFDGRNEAMWLDYFKVIIPFCFGVYKYFDYKDKELRTKYLELSPKIIVNLQWLKRDVFKLKLTNADERNVITDIFISDVYVLNKLEKNEIRVFKISFNDSKEKNVINLNKEYLEFNDKGYPKELTINCTDKENNDWLSYYQLIENDTVGYYVNSFNEMV